MVHQILGVQGEINEKHVGSKGVNALIVVQPNTFDRTVVDVILPLYITFSIMKLMKNINYFVCLFGVRFLSACVLLSD